MRTNFLLLGALALHILNPIMLKLLSATDVHGLNAVALPQANYHTKKILDGEKKNSLQQFTKKRKVQFAAVATFSAECTLARRNSKSKCPARGLFLHSPCKCVYALPEFIIFSGVRSLEPFFLDGLVANDACAKWKRTHYGLHSGS